jgi:hypothetical protein
MKTRGIETRYRRREIQYACGEIINEYTNTTI